MTSDGGPRSTVPYDLTIEDRSTYLYACVQAEVADLYISVNYVNEVISHLRQRGARRMLFVREIPMMASWTDYSITASAIINILPRGVRVALVDRSPAHRMVVDIVNEQAIRKQRDIRAFEAVAEAETWLLADSTHPVEP